MADSRLLHDGKNSTAEAFSFLFNRGAIGRCFRQALEKDRSGARLSRTFRWYYRLRPFIPIAMRQLLQWKRNSRIELPDRWFIPTKFFEDLSDAVGTQRCDVIHPWPKGFQFATSLTHDVETAYGFKLIDKLARIEEQLGLHSSWNLVPGKYAIDQGLVRDLIDRGFEIGVHGYNHDGRLFESQRTFARRAKLINEAKSAFQATGFRAPMVHRQLNWIREQLEFDYDASCFDIDPLQAMPGGVGSIWPFMIDDSMVEIPYTMPQDHTLLVTLGQNDTSVWQEKFEFLKRNSGMVLMLTHPDYLDSPKRLELYRRFLEKVAESEAQWHCLPREIASWWSFRELSMDRCHSARPDDNSTFFNGLETCRSVMWSENSEIRFEQMA